MDLQAYIELPSQTNDEDECMKECHTTREMVGAVVAASVISL